MKLTLKDQPRCVNVFHDVVVYSLSAEESDHGLIYLVYLNEDCVETTVKDFAPDDSCKLLQVENGIQLFTSVTSLGPSS